MRAGSSEKGKKPARGDGEKPAVGKAKRVLILHPILFAVVPILALCAHNAGQVYVSAVVRPLAVMVALALALMGLLGIVLRNRRKAGVLVSLGFLLFFSFGHLRAALGEWGWGVLGVNIGPAKVAVLMMGLAFIGCAYFSLKTRRDLRRLTNGLNVAACCLVLAAVVRVGLCWVKARAAEADGGKRQTAAAAATEAGGRAELPHIYYIILDSYARADVLRDVYQHDNSVFVDYLTRKGFYVARKSRSNYCHTDLSLPSSLNLAYHDKLVERIGAECGSREPLRKLLQKSRVVSLLKEHGYTIVSFPGGCSCQELKKADVRVYCGLYLNEFESGLLDMTPIPALLSKLTNVRPYTLYLFALQRKRISYAFDHLADVCERESPVFVFAHVMSPHPPFVFGPRGEAVNPKEEFWEAERDEFRESSREVYLNGYRDQLVHINTRVRPLVEKILARSARPVIIILQADHGSRGFFHWSDPEKVNFKEAFGILNAIYLPDKARVPLYEEMTPVNTFRLIFNAYLGTNLKRLKDESYYSTYTRPYKFLNVTEKVEWSPMKGRAGGSPLPCVTGRFRP